MLEATSGMVMVMLTTLRTGLRRTISSLTYLGSSKTPTKSFVTQRCCSVSRIRFGGPPTYHKMVQSAFPLQYNQTIIIGSSRCMSTKRISKRGEKIKKAKAKEIARKNKKSSRGVTRKDKNDKIKPFLSEYRRQLSEMESSENVQNSANDYTPPSQLLSTASPNVWISKCHAEEYEIDASRLFKMHTAPPSASKSAGSDYDNLLMPHAFRVCKFQYAPPKAFDFELPKFSIPEVAFLGRSNVGKSSLVNSITRTKDLCRTSKTPGRTQQVNYLAMIDPRKKSTAPVGNATSSLRVSDALAFFVDLPGFGYSEAPVDKIDLWQKTTTEFLLSRTEFGTMTRVYLLIDSRHGTQDFDRSVMQWLDEASIPYTLVFTKADAANKASLIRYINDSFIRYLLKVHMDEEGYQGPTIHVTSSKTGQGIAELMWAIDSDFKGYYNPPVNSDDEEHASDDK